MFMILRSDAITLFLPPVSEVLGLPLDGNWSTVKATFQALQTLAGSESRVVFDYVRSSVLRGDNTLYGEAGAARSVSKVQEQWLFGLDPGQVEVFLADYGLRLSDHADANELERRYFTGANGRLMARVNGTHAIVTAVRI